MREDTSVGMARPLLDRIADWRERRPDQPAIDSGGRVITYDELHRSARRVAGKLRRAGVTRDVLVPLWLERSPELVVAALGALLAGGAYVGMDVQDPPGRVAQILADCAAPVVLTTRRLAGSLPAGHGTAVFVEDLVADESVEEPDGPGGAPDDLCYVTFTSGSTGAPKGVLVEHRGVAELVAWHIEKFAVRPGDRMPTMARPSFDGWGLEVWPCLAGGATLCLADNRLPESPQDMVDWLRDERITVGFFTTVLATQLLDARWPRDGVFRAMLLGGEKLHAPPRIRPKFALYNVYGPTETTMLATCGEITADAPADTPPPIGSPLPGLRAHVLDENRRPVPDGESGELHLSGIQVARGYLNRPELTERKFLPDTEHPRERMYATGDIVRRRPDGQLEFLGRNDSQIKLRGFRIEPGEIEAAMLELPGVTGAAVVVHETPGQDGAPLRRLVGYWTGAGDGSDSEHLGKLLAAAVPSYLLPHPLVRLDALPLTPHGKTDRPALAARPLDQPTEQNGGFRNDVERVLAEVWAKVLGLAAVGRADSFFDLGGDSILAMRAAAEARRRGVRLVAEDFFETDILHELAQSLLESISTLTGREGR